MSKNGNIRHKSPSVFVVLLSLLFAMLTVSPSHALQSNCRPSSDTQASFAPNDCVFPYPDEGLSNNLDTCRNLSGISGIGDLTDPGRDYLLDASIVGIKSAGIVQAPRTLTLKATVTSDCRRWAAYALSGYLIPPTGDKLPITFSTGNFNKFDPTYDLQNYCFLVFTGGCGYTDYSGSVTIPANAQSGSYAVLIHATSSGVSSNVGLPIADKNYTFSNILEISGINSSTPIPTPIPTLTISSELLIAPHFSFVFDGTKLVQTVESADLTPLLPKYSKVQMRAKVIGPNGVQSDPSVSSLLTNSSNLTFNWNFENGIAIPGIWSAELSAVLDGVEGPWSNPVSVNVAAPKPKLIPSAKAPIVKKKVIKPTKKAVPSKSSPSAKAATSKTVSKQTSNSSQTVSQFNAARKAKSYLDMSGFSRSGLISQLEYEGFSTADATFGTDAQNANWNLQAARKGKSYLDMSGFSRDGLIGQLEYEGFSNSEATYGANANGL